MKKFLLLTLAIALVSSFNVTALANDQLPEGAENCTEIIVDIAVEEENSEDSGAEEALDPYALCFHSWSSWIVEARNMPSDYYVCFGLYIWEERTCSKCDEVQTRNFREEPTYHNTVNGECTYCKTTTVK